MRSLPEQKSRSSEYWASAIGELITLMLQHFGKAPHVLQLHVVLPLPEKAYTDELRKAAERNAVCKCGMCLEGLMKSGAGR